VEFGGMLHGFLSSPMLLHGAAAARSAPPLARSPGATRPVTVAA
jgi:hypothetical protein